MVTLPRETFLHKGKLWERLPEEFYESWTMGVDLGQSMDFTCASVVKHTRTPLDSWDAQEATGQLRQMVDEKFDVVGLRRLPLGTPYPDQVSIIQQLLAAPPLHGQADLAIDQTGPGAAVGDIFAQRGLDVTRIVLTAGAEVTRHPGRKYGVPKSVLVSNIDARLHLGELRFAADLGEGEALRSELANFQRHVTASGRSIFEARTGQHDDIVLSVGCALWWAVQRRGRQMQIGYVRHY